MTALSGVRSSCDMLARNSDLCRLATSSSALLRSSSRNSRALWMASADWLAKVCEQVAGLLRSPRRPPADHQGADDAVSWSIGTATATASPRRRCCR